MRVDSTEVMIDWCTKFFRSLHIYGWFHDPQDNLDSFEVIDSNIEIVSIKTCLFHGGVETLGTDKGFSAVCLMSRPEFPINAKIVFKTTLGRKLEFLLLDLLKESAALRRGNLSNQFREITNKTDGNKLLDLGGRDRSKLDRSLEFPNCEVTVFDILDGKNVDVVGDAHQLSDHFPEETFDFIYSVSVFEHLIMPWKVALEMNKIMKIGGYALIHSHQTLGLHDQPWDFWRFSDESWKAIFNTGTGFEIIATAMEEPSFVTPFHWRPGKDLAENSVGFEGCNVIVKKINIPSEDWKQSTKDVVDTIYPNHEDGNVI